MKDDTLCELYADTYSDVSGDCETEILDSESETSTVRGSNELHSSDDKTSQEIQDAGRLFKILHVHEYLLQKFRSVYNPPVT